MVLGLFAFKGLEVFERESLPAALRSSRGLWALTGLEGSWGLYSESSIVGHVMRCHAVELKGCVI